MGILDVRFSKLRGVVWKFRRRQFVGAQCASEGAEAFGPSLTSDFQIFKRAVEQLLEDRRLASMSLEQHLDWAMGLPRCSGKISLPDALADIVCFTCSRESETQAFRSKAKAYWAERKRVTAPHWARAFAELPRHVRRALGPDKNLFLFQEMLEASGSPDLDLPRCLAQGFPLLGEYSQSGTLPLKERPRITHRSTWVAAPTTGKA